MAQHITSIPELLDAQEQGLTPDAGDIVLAVRGNGTYREIVFSLSQLREFFTTNPDMFKVGTSEWKNVQGTGPTIGGLAALSAGVIEALTEFVVGGSKWERGDNKPTITGLYGLEAGNVGTTNLQADTIDAHGEGVTTIQVKKRLVRDNAPGKENEPLLLGPTQVGGGLKVTGNLDAFGGLTLTNHIWNASASDIYSKIDGLGDNQIAFIFNDTSSGITLSPSSESHLRRSFTIPSYTAVQVVCSGQHVYVVGGEYA